MKPPATKKSLTLGDAELVRKAWKLVRNNTIKDSLPPRYELKDLMVACLQFEQLIDKFISKYGERLRHLDPTAYRELALNRPFNFLINDDNNPD